MARSQNPMDVHRRQQRKKELQKNKAARIQARDEQVKQTKSVAEVKEAIQKLEKRKAHLTHPERQKLDRLYKELKLTKQAHEERTSHHHNKQQERPLTELDDPRKSVYWDEVMNPYGAPPPGQPRLYHKRGGGVTMNMKDAVVPGEEEQQVETQTEIERAVEAAAIPPPPPPPPRRDEAHHVPPPLQHETRQNHIPPPPPPPPSLPPPPPPPPPPSLPPPPPPPPMPKDQASSSSSSSFVPSLPPPSQAVQRISKKKKRQGLDVDVWASTEEVEYHKTHDQMELEGSATNNADVLWWYKDNTSHQIQGPFSSIQMQSWYQGGFFPPTTPVRKGDATTFVNISQIDWNVQVAKAAGKASMSKKRKRKTNKNQNESTIEDRIAALRSQRQPESEVSNEVNITAVQHDNEEETGVDDRIAMLRSQHVQNDSESTVDERIAALRGDYEEEEQQQQQQDDDNSVEARIAALRAERTTINEKAQDETNIPEPEHINAVDVNARPANAAAQSDEMPSYPVELDVEERAQEGEEPPPAYYPLPDDMDQGDGAVAPYPSDLDYPVSDAYPLDDVGDGNEYPYVVAPYPTEGDPADLSSATNQVDGVVQEPIAKKVYKADKEVVGLVPSNLQKRRGNKKTKLAPVEAKVGSSSAKQQQRNVESISPAKTKSVADDYDDFMKEINDLKK